MSDTMQDSTVSAITEAQSLSQLQMQADEYWKKTTKCMDKWEQDAQDEEKEHTEAEKEISNTLEVPQSTAQQSCNFSFTSDIDKLVKKPK
eukprot:9034378-Ditylum_brightwellii.AAC.1